VWSSILIVLNAGWLLLVLFGLPGNWLMVLSTCLFAWWQWDQGVFSGWTLIAITALALLGELIEFLAGMVGARGSGASWWASVAAVVGAVLGAVFGTFVIPIPLLGTVIGASVGRGWLYGGSKPPAGSAPSTPSAVPWARESVSSSAPSARSCLAWLSG